MIVLDCFMRIKGEGGGGTGGPKQKKGGQSAKWIQVYDELNISLFDFLYSWLQVESARVVDSCSVILLVG